MGYTTVHGKVVRRDMLFVQTRTRSVPATPIHPEKGIKGGRCNVTACQKPGAVFYSKSTGRYYCQSCAEQINWPGGRADVMALYGVPLLCEVDEQTTGEDHVPG